MMQTHKLFEILFSSSSPTEKLVSPSNNLALLVSSRNEQPEKPQSIKSDHIEITIIEEDEGTSKVTEGNSTIENKENINFSVHQPATISYSSNSGLNLFF